MNEIAFTIKEAPGGGFTARAVSESIFAEADSILALHQQVRDAVSCHFNPEKKPKLIRLRFIREEVIAA